MKYRWLWLAPLLLLLLLVIGLFLVLGTSSGTRFILSQVVPRVPGLKIAHIDGTLLGHLELQGIDYQQNGMAVAIKRFSLEWRPSRLLRREIDLKTLAIDGILYTQEPDKTAAPPSSGEITLPSFNLPLNLVVEKATAREMSIHRGEQVITVDDLSLSGRADQSGLHIELLEVHAPAFEIGMKGALRSEAASSVGNPRIEALLHWSVKGTVDQVVRGEGEIKGDLNRLALNHRVTEPFQVGTHGTLSLKEGIPSVDLKGEWQAVRWPIEVSTDGKSQIESPQGTYSISGTADDYQFKVEGAVLGAALPTSRLQVTGGGDQEQLQIKRLQIKTLNGEIAGDGKVAWKPVVSWQAALTGSHLQPEVQWPDWKGTLSFAAGSKGKLTEKGPIAQVALSTLKGTLRGYPVSAQGELNVEEEKYHIQRLIVKSGSAMLNASGKVDDRWDLSWKLQAPNLAALWPEAKGSLTGNGTVQGPRLQPKGKVQLLGEELALQDQQIKKLALALLVDLQDKEPSDIELNAEGVNAGGQKVKTVSLTAKGKLSEHRVAADVQTVEQRLQLQLDGRLEGKQWQGKLNRADIQDKSAGRWGLQKPVGIKAVLGGETSGETTGPPVHPSVAVEEGCWESTTADPKQKRDARLCLAGQWEQEIGWQANAVAQKIPLALFKPFFPPDLNLSGTIDAEGNGKSENGQLQGAAKLIPSPGSLFYRPADGEQIEVGYREGLFQAALNEGRLQTTVRLTLVGQGSIQADVGLSPLTPGEDLGKSRLEGKVDLRLTQLGLLTALTPMIEESSGRIDLQATLGGTVNQPEIKGEATLTQGSAVVPSLGIHVTELQLTLQSSGDGMLAIRGGAKSGPGALQIGGSVTLDAKQGWPMQLTFKGDRFQILDTHEANVLASPDLKLQIQKPRINLTGEILIPDASLTLRELPKGAVKVSDDTVIVHDDPAGKGGKTDDKKAAAWEISSDVMIRLGEKVTFSGFGLTARITGNLRAIDQPGKLTLGEGQLQIVDGQYRAYGQKLDIANGRLIFGGPINNPGLDIRATRKAEKEEVTAGILVRGTLQKPETTVFSDPPMDQAEALSYLLLGRPLNQASSGEGDFLTKAISALGLKGGDFLAKKIGRKLGLDEVKVEAGENAEQATLVVGRYFSPKFYVSYGIGLFESINTLHIRYKINRKLTLQGDSGTESGMDLIYTKEYN